MGTAGDAGVALVTGGSSGIGYAIVEALADRGLRVYLCARTDDDVQLAVKRCQARGLAVAGQVGDVRSADQMRDVVAGAVEHFGPLSVLVNNAGRSGGGPTASITDELWHDVIDTNLNGVFVTTRAALTVGRLPEAGAAGRIINIASTGGKQGVPLGAPYSAAKGGVIAFTKALAKELAPTGVTVNAVCPGYVETPMAGRVREAYAKTWGITADQVLEKFNAKIPLGRYTTPQEVAAMVDYLTTEPAAAVTAQALNVCGGLGIF